MTFYVNEVGLKGVSDYTHRVIGLFDNNDWAGKGYFCGWYGAEYYLNTNLLAYGIQLINGSTCYDPKVPFNGGFYGNANIHFDEVRIGSGMWEKRIEADSIEEAIAIFKNQSW